MSGKTTRISRLFNSTTGRSVIIPVDHGVAMGALQGLQDPHDVLARLVALRIDGTLLTPGLWKVVSGLFERRDAPARVLTADLPLFSTLPGEPADVSEDDVLVSVDFALRHAFDAIKILLVWGLERDKQMANLKMVGRLADECDRWSLPLMVEPVLWGMNVPKERKNDSKLMENAARIALELGADILKIPYTGEVEPFSAMVRRLRVPVLVLGGPKMSGIRDVFQVARDSLVAGARGIVFGRNVWQHPAMESVVRGLIDIVHGNMDVETALANRALND
ncbi:MAG: fructose-bisphosphate aldolase [Vicinamibacteria bacterium]|nr:fructose-bisphosphate aldolase [Vicinamibacteria bacterium]